MNKNKYTANFILISFILLLTLISKPKVECITVFSGVGVANTGIYVLETSMYDIQTTLTVINVTKSSDNSTLFPSKILWNYTDYQTNKKIVWNSTSIIIPRSHNDSNIMSFNTTVWINESIPFWFLVGIRKMIHFISIDINATLISATPVVENISIIFIVPVFAFMAIVSKKKKVKK